MTSKRKALQALFLLSLFSLVSVAAAHAAGSAIGSPTQRMILPDTPPDIPTGVFTHIVDGAGGDSYDAVFIKKLNSYDRNPLLCTDSLTPFGSHYAILKPIAMTRVYQVDTSPGDWRIMEASQERYNTTRGDGDAPLALVPERNLKITPVAIGEIIVDHVAEKNPGMTATNGMITIHPGSPTPTVAPGSDCLMLETSPAKYHPAMSSTPGIQITARCSGKTPGGSCTMRWKCTSGHFLLWNPPGFQVHDLGNETSPVSGPVYWTYGPGEISLPGTARITATSDSGASASLVIFIDEYGYATAGAVTG